MKTARISTRLIACILIGVFMLSACIPKGAKNWLFSIGPQTYAVALGDLDGDSDLDAYLANGENEVPVPDTVWINDGTGSFTNSAQQIGERESRKIILADMDRDSDLDAVVANTGDITVYMNNGKGIFGPASIHLGQPAPGAWVLATAVGDMNGDGWLDVLGGGCCGAVETQNNGSQKVYPAYDSLWLSNSLGQLADSGQRFDLSGTNAVALGDLNGDGSLDAYFANSSTLSASSGNMGPTPGDSVWINNGQGIFTLSSQALSTKTGQEVTLGDLDGDGDLDVFLGNRENVEIWLNQGGRQGGKQGRFVQASWSAKVSSTRALFLNDMDADGDLDALVVGSNQAVLWLNNGMATFSAGPKFNFEPQHALAVGDMNQDGFPDVIAGSVNHGIRVWLNNGDETFSIK